MTADQPAPRPEPHREDEPAAEPARGPRGRAGGALGGRAWSEVIQIPLTLGRGRAPAKAAVLCEEGYPRTEAQVRAVVEFAMPVLQEIRTRRGFTPAAGYWTVGLLPAHVPWRTHLSPTVADRVAADLATRPPGTAVVIVALIDPADPTNPGSTPPPTDPASPHNTQPAPPGRTAEPQFPGRPPRAR